MRHVYLQPNNLKFYKRTTKKKVFVVSISDENETKIRSYLEKRPIDLMVVSDYENVTFQKYNILSRPHAVLLDLEGNLLWKGHPSDLTQEKLDQFYTLHSNDNSKENIDKIIKKSDNKNNSSYKVLSNNDSITYNELESDEEELIETEDEVFFKGSLSDLYFILKQINSFDLKFSEGTNKKLQIISKKQFWITSPDQIIKEALLYLNLKSEQNIIEIEGYEIVVKNEKLLWDSNQFNWDGSLQNYMIGTDRIQADNMDIHSLSSLLSNAKQKRFFYLGNDEKLYDWDFQFLYEDLMFEELSSSFGIEIKANAISSNVIHIQKR